MTIPEDVKVAAYVAMNTVGKDGALGVIAQAILTERQRCAAVARANAHAECEVAEQIEQAILNP